MKVLLAHKFLHMTGGTEQYFRDLAHILAANGHETVPFGLADERNPQTGYEKYLLPSIDYRNKSKLYKLRNVGRIFSRTLYSFEAKRRIDALVRDVKPDLAHLQSIEHHISPSILHALKRQGVPMVQSVNTYKHVCASYRLYLFDKQTNCERCLYGKHWHAISTRCVKGSLFASTLAAIEMTLHQQIMKVYHHIDRFIVPNRFMEQRMLGAGYPQHKLVRLLNPLDLNEYQVSDERGDFVLYFGRIDPEKGVLPLVQAMSKVKSLRLVVVGDGLQRAACEAEAKRLGLSNVDFVGPKWGDELRPYLMKCRAVIVPSLWYEPSPYVIYQALAAGKPVIASRTGGIPDLLTPETGRLVEPGDVEGLAQAIEEVAGDEQKLRAMSSAARAWAERELCPQRYYEKLMHVYDEARQEAAT